MLFLTGQMVTQPLARYLILQLGIELRIVDGCLKINITLHTYTDKPSATAWIGQRGTLIRRTDKRGIAAMTRIGLAVRWAIFQIGGRYEILQHDLLTLGDLIELIEIDERKRGQAQVQVVLVLEVDAVVIVLALVPGQQETTERSLATALSSYENRYEGITRELPLASPHRHH